jgi:excisionase family DNA binding protein
MAEPPIILSPDEPAGDIVFVAVPSNIADAVTDLLSRLGQGHVVAISSLPAELSLQQAAELAGCEREVIVAAIDGGDLVFRSDGGHRRVRLDDFLQWRQRTL